jgi:hypothetical protein
MRRGAKPGHAGRGRAVMLETLRRDLIADRAARASVNHRMLNLRMLNPEVSAAFLASLFFLWAAREACASVLAIVPARRFPRLGFFPPV